MEKICTVDCGTTNSRISIVDREGAVLKRLSKKIGVKDTAIRGDNSYLKNGLRELLDETLSAAGAQSRDISFICSSGMITSELGIAELPHVFTPASMQDLADSITEIGDDRNFYPGLKLYFIRGVKNLYRPETNDLRQLAGLDFMRGEETQAAGLLRLYGIGKASTFINLSSHTKIIPIDEKGRILGCITTLSGQVLEALIKETFIGKSVAPDDGSDAADVPFDREIVDLAYDIVQEGGLLRSFMMPRFMDVLLKTDWRQRRKFIESALAADDLGALRLVPKRGYSFGERIFLVGPGSRCELFSYFLRSKMNIDAEITSIADSEEVDRLAVHGSLYLAEMKGLL